MAYQFDFAPIGDYGGLILSGIGVTAGLTSIGAVFGVGLGVAIAWSRWERVPLVSSVAVAYVEVLRNTPFLVQLFFIFFGLPALGLRLGELEAAALTMVLNLGAYSAEIVRAGIQAVPPGQIEAAESLAMSRLQIFRHVILVPALQKIWPALSSQIVIVMLGSSVCSQIAAEDLTFAANFIQSRTFRAFEVFFVATLLYLLMSVILRWLLKHLGGWIFGRRSYG
jgi:polar amino acid transport system permease protein